MKKHDIIINFIKEQATLSKCEDGKTAAILVSADMKQIYSIGVNGGPIGGMQCMCQPAQRYEMPGLYGTTHKVDKPKYSCVHAEMNCLVKNTCINDIPKILICTKQPCQVCASLIINSNTNIIAVWYIDDYWDETGVNILKEAKINVEILIKSRETKSYCFASTGNIIE